MDGTCGSTASAIFTYYYYDYVSKSYINNKKYIGTTDKYQKALVNNFKTLLGDDGKGTTYHKKSKSYFLMVKLKGLSMQI